MKIETIQLRTKGKDFTYNLVDGVLVSRNCSSCMEMKDVTCFNKSPTKYLGYYPVCKPCLKLEYKTRYSDNKEAYRKRNRAVYLKNPSIAKAGAKRWRENNREKSNEYHYARDRDKRQRALTKKYHSDMRKLYAECRELNKTRTDRLTLDHIIPINGENVSGLHVPWNIQFLPFSENARKNNKFDGTYENESWRSHG